MLQKYIEILTRDEVIFRKKPDGTEVNYFLFPEFEIHINRRSFTCAVGKSENRRARKLANYFKNLCRRRTYSDA